MLPVLTSDADYAYWYHQVTPWLPGLALICQRHGLAADRLERAPEGSTIVFYSGEAMIKLVPLKYAEMLERESVGLVKVQGHLPLRTPEVLAAGELGGWAYLITGRLPGTAIKNIWSSLREPDQHRLVRRIGELLQALQRVDPSGLPGGWPAFVRERCERFASVQRSFGLSEELIPAFAEALRRAVQSLPKNPPEVFLHSDVGYEHLLLQEIGGRWELTGLVDFGSTMAGYRLYELAVPCAMWTSHRPDLRRELLAGYGVEVTEEQLLASMLLHRTCNLPAVLKHAQVRGTPDAFRACYCRM